MKYKGYTGIVEFDEEAEVLFGRVIGLRDVITFQGESVAEVTKAFHDSVDFYLDFCSRRGERPEKPYSGQFVLRLSPRLHRELSVLAEEKATSLNSLISDMLENHAFFAQWASPSFTKKQDKISGVVEKKRASEKIVESKSELRKLLRDKSVADRIHQLRGSSTKKK